MSSFGESVFALDDPSPNRIRFYLERVMRTEYRIDDYQQNYFVIPSFEELLRSTVETDFAPLYSCLETLPDIKIAELSRAMMSSPMVRRTMRSPKGLRRRSFKRPPSAKSPSRLC